MREPEAHLQPFGLIAEFDDGERLVEALRKAHAAGFSRLDSYSPYPLEGMPEALGFHDRRLALLTLAGGIFGAVFGYGMQVFAIGDFPIDIGGRPLFAWQSFLMVSFELAVLFAVLAAVFGMLVLNRLPRLHHPVFDVPGFERVNVDRFFLIIFGDDASFEPAFARSFLESLAPRAVHTVGKAEEPE